MKSWILLVLAIIFEVAGTTSMKLSEGFQRLIPSVALFLCYAISFVAITIALREIEVSIAYAIWSGVGTALISLIGICYFRESLTMLKVLSIVFIILGVIGLHLAGSKQ